MFVQNVFRTSPTSRRGSRRTWPLWSTHRLRSAAPSCPTWSHTCSGCASVTTLTTRTDCPVALTYSRWDKISCGCRRRPLCRCRLSSKSLSFAVLNLKVICRTESTTASLYGLIVKWNLIYNISRISYKAFRVTFKILNIFYCTNILLD